MSGISDKAIKSNYAENKFRYNDGTELASKEFSDGSGLDFYETGYRSYDPQLGRFWQIDPIGEATADWSPYLYAANNPIFFNDPMGLDTAHYGDPVVVTATKKDCKTCNAPSVAAGIPRINPNVNPLRVVPKSPPGEIKPINDPKPFALPAPGLLGTVVVTAAATLYPNSFGPEGIPQPNPLFGHLPDSREGRDNGMTLYRGVNPLNPNFKLALEGIAMPVFGDDPHNDPARHNDGDVGSIYTSWTYRPAVAVEKAGPYGVVLVKRFSMSQLIFSPDKYKEREILVPGVVFGAAVFPAWTTRRL
jgi:RHS repeat-associated protein